MAFQHLSVMLAEVTGYLLTDVAGTYVDCTLGGGGHALGIASALNEKGRLIGLDRDDVAIAAATTRLVGVKCEVDLVRANFASLDDILTRRGIDGATGILFDLGVSSPQIDTAERGFSYMRDARLDMRMDRRQKLSAYDLVNELDEGELRRIFYEYGEERCARSIAAKIVKERAVASIVTTAELVRIIEGAVPAAVKRKSAGRGHVAKRVFQALRIAVNDELSILPAALTAAVKHLKSGGRLAVITFHSLEDGVVKRTLKKMATGCLCPPELPVCVCGHQPEIKLVGKSLTPSDKEISANPRAKSARLRLAEKL